LTAVPLTEVWRGVANCLNCNIGRSTLSIISRERDCYNVHRSFDQFSFSTGEPIYKAGQNGASLFTIRKGLVKLSHFLPAGGERIVRLSRASDVLGLECLAADTYRDTATALQPTEVCCLPIGSVKYSLSRDQKLFHMLIAHWYRALCNAERWITELSTGTARERVIRLLLWLSESEAGGNCTLFSREDLGAVLGLTTETASRVMAELKRQGLIKECSHNHFTCDLARLRQAVERSIPA
jgi:CRP/FNR family transcriptional regulator, anaerobic regulatory protein